MKALLVHPGNVSRARLRPLNPLHIASCTPDGLVLFWDYSKHPSFPSPPTQAAAAAATTGSSPGGSLNVAKPQMALLGHGEASVEGLAWSAADKNRLVSVDCEGVCCLWDVGSTSNASSSSKGGIRPGDVAPDGVQLAGKTLQMSPVRLCHPREKGNASARLNDVELHPHHPELAVIAAEDSSCLLMDWRQETAVAATAAAEAAANAVSWSPQEPCVFAIGDSSGTVSLFDTRCLRRSFLSLSVGPMQEGRTTQGASINTVHFHPDFAFLLGAAAEDGTVALWDVVAASGKQQRNLDQQQEDKMQADGSTSETLRGNSKGPPGLLFVHAGHSAPITDFCWRTARVPPPNSSGSSSSSVYHLRQSLLGASVSFDNKVQLWQPAELVFCQTAQVNYVN